MFIFCCELDFVIVRQQLSPSIMSNTKFYHRCITEYVQVQGHVVQLQIHPISCNSSNQSCQPHFWFKDRHLQEVIQLIKIPLFKRSECSVSDKDKKEEPASYSILSGNTIRLVYTFKKSPARQYFLIMNDCENNLGQFENFHLKSEKLVIFVCQIEKGIENLLKAVNDSEGLTSSQQTVSISSYFSQLPQSKNTENSQQRVGNPETKDSSDICNTDTSKKEKLKSIVSRVKRLRQKRTSKHKSCQRLAESRDGEKITNPASTSLEANGQCEVSSPPHSDILKESNHTLNSNLASDNWVQNLSFNGASLSDSLLSYESDRFSQDNNSDGSTSSDENLPYYGISDKCSDAGGLSSVSSNLESDFQPNSLLASPPNSPTKFGSCPVYSHPSSVSANQTGDSKSGKIKSRCKKKALKAPRVKELKDSKAKPEDSKEGASGSRFGIMNVHNLTPKQIMRLVKESEDYLRKIFEGKTASWRHEMYKTGGPERHRLNFQCQFGNLSPKQLDIIMEGLFNIFCKKHLKYEDYVSKVMLAEAIIKIHMDIYQISHKEAEDMLQ